MLASATAYAAPVYSPEIVATYAHDPGAFTQGLLYFDGELYESTGRHGKSTIRRVEIDSGEVLAQHRLDKQYFAEGLALVGNRLIQLSWKSGVGFVYDRDTLEPLDRFEYAGEGWGLTYDGEHLIMSDGSATLRRLNPDTYEQVGQLEVTYQGQPVPRLNELEMVRDELWANLWPSDQIARIDLSSGKVIGVINASNLKSALRGAYKTDVLNGIAYDKKNDRLFMTGKLWPSLFEVRVPE